MIHIFRALAGMVVALFFILCCGKAVNPVNGYYIGLAVLSFYVLNELGKG